MSETITLEGRIVAGHPMSFAPVLDDANQPRLKPDGTQVQECFFMLAVPKASSPDWKQTPWGQTINRVATAAYARNETARPDFSWKVQDGDSQIPNKNGNVNAQREGFPGHWIVTLKTRLRPTPCFHNGKYSPMEQIQESGEINCGDYGRVQVEIAANGTSAQPSKTPGVYLNPNGFSLDRKGEIIQTQGSFDAAAAFGSAPPAPAPAAAMPPPVAPPAPSAPPAPDFLAGPPPAPAAEPKYLVQGKAYTRAQLANWTDEQIATLPKA